MRITKTVSTSITAVARNHIELLSETRNIKYFVKRLKTILFSVIPAPPAVFRKGRKVIKNVSNTLPVHYNNISVLSDCVNKCTRRRKNAFQSRAIRVRLNTTLVFIMTRSQKGSAACRRAQRVYEREGKW